ncbi:MAG: hypothetical protein MZV64_63470 [Ignavibacteriales bacterium]|nr:hypothetical protein [Ignavibacteriales bacterium]
MYLSTASGFDIVLPGFDAATLAGKTVKVKGNLLLDHPPVFLADSVETSPGVSVYTRNQEFQAEDFVEMKVREGVPALTITGVAKAEEWEGKGTAKVYGKLVKGDVNYYRPRRRQGQGHGQDHRRFRQHLLELLHPEAEAVRRVLVLPQGQGQRRREDPDPVQGDLPRRRRGRRPLLSFDRIDRTGTAPRPSLFYARDGASVAIAASSGSASSTVRTRLPFSARRQAVSPGLGPEQPGEAGSGPDDAPDLGDRDFRQVGGEEHEKEPLVPVALVQLAGRVEVPRPESDRDREPGAAAQPLGQPGERRLDPRPPRQEGQNGEIVPVAPAAEEARPASRPASPRRPLRVRAGLTAAGPPLAAARSWRVFFLVDSTSG